MAELRAEIQETANIDSNWTYGAYACLEKLDSVLRESHRMSPPTILGLRRLFKQSFTLNDGTHIPRSGYVAMPIYAVENDPKVTPDPTVFNGLRNYHLRQTHSANRSEYQFASPEPTALQFGYSKMACPGRHSASLVVKMVVVKLLSEFEFRFSPGTGRPQNLLAHDFLFCRP
jgi:cytochrome P450